MLKIVVDEWFDVIFTLDLVLARSCTLQLARTCPLTEHNKTFTLVVVDHNHQIINVMI